MRVCLDPGHGGEGDPGAVYGDVREHLYTLTVAQELAEACEVVGLDVSMTRQADEYVPWSLRRQRAEGADLVVSIHVNASEYTETSGAQAYHWPGNARTKAIGEHWLELMPSALVRHRYNRCIPADLARGTWIQSPRAVIGSFPQDVVLLELFFASNPGDRNVMLHSPVAAQVWGATVNAIFRDACDRKKKPPPPA